jgi:hypothetical protein
LCRFAADGRLQGPRRERAVAEFDGHDRTRRGEARPHEHGRCGQHADGRHRRQPYGSGGRRHSRHGEHGHRNRSKTENGQRGRRAENASIAVKTGRPDAVGSRTTDTSHLYEPLIERDLDAIPEAVREFRRSHSSGDLFLAVARFAILAYAPSLHSKHSVITALCAHEFRHDPQWDDFLIECARYAAESRQPWSEPPILEPPPVESDQPRDLEALRAAVAARDRLAAEKWLAARLDDPDLARDLFVVAADDVESVLLTSAAIRLAHLLGEKGRYAALRIAVWEMVAATEAPDEPGSQVVTREQLLDHSVAEKGSIESVHAVFLFDAAHRTAAFPRVARSLAAVTLHKPASELPRTTMSPVYRLARDFGHHLRACATGDQRLQSATAYNLKHAESAEDWSLA